VLKNIYWQAKFWSLLTPYLGEQGLQLKRDCWENVLSSHKALSALWSWNHSKIYSGRGKADSQTWGPVCIKGGGEKMLRSQVIGIDRILDYMKTGWEVDFWRPWGWIFSIALVPSAPSPHLFSLCPLLLVGSQLHALLLRRLLDMLQINGLFCCLVFNWV
jgi:hypothetical protein